MTMSWSEGEKCLSQWRHAGLRRGPAQATELHDKVGGHEKVPTFKGNEGK